MSVEQSITNSEKRRVNSPSWIWAAIFIGLLAVAAYFRFVGLDWDDGQHVHPDERFLTMVASSVSPVERWSDFFNTDTSTLNPHNVGYSFYVYGTLPLFIVRYVGEWLGETGYGDIYLVGRFLSATFDLLTVILAFLIAAKLYKNTRIALLGMAFSAFAVMQIQLSHYFTVDIFANFFTYLAMFFAVMILELFRENGREDPSSLGRWTWKSTRAFIGFGAALGLAVASKVNTAAAAMLLPLAVGIGLFYISDAEKRWEILYSAFWKMVAAAFIAVIVFRLFQPYAFVGPHFWNVGINPKWWANLQELRAQASGDVDFPPALQWARRPLWFGWKNLTLWGLGLPLGLAAWAAFLWMGLKIFKKEAREHLFIWGWTLVYFAWQGVGFGSSMRYLIPVYPSLAIIAAWGIVVLWERVRNARINQVVIEENGEHTPEKRDATGRERPKRWLRVAAGALSVIVIAGAFLWAFAFTRIYTRPESRVAASSWIYQNIPGGINLRFMDQSGAISNLPYAMSAGQILETGKPILMSFEAQKSGLLKEFTIPGMVDLRPAVDLQNQPIARNIIISVLDEAGATLGTGQIFEVITGDVERVFLVQEPFEVEEGQTYFLRYEISDQDAAISLTGRTEITIDAAGSAFYQYMPDFEQAIRPEQPLSLSYVRFPDNGTLDEVAFYRIVDWEKQAGEKTLEISLSVAGEETPIAKTYITSAFEAGKDARGNEYIAAFPAAVAVEKDEIYMLQIRLVDGNGAIAIYSNKPILETSWDMTVPFDLGMGNAFDDTAGVYRTNLNLEMYWDDNVEKRERILSMLEQGDILLSSTNRVWGTVPRVPERYPLSSEFYRLLLGCPDDRDVVWCYNVAEVGMFKGELGYDLVNVSTSYPNLGPIQFNTQFAEEAFTVYDHAKVMVFQKSADYDSDKVRALLEIVDISMAVHITPRKASSYKGIAVLPESVIAEQKEGGTWSEFFKRAAVFNQYPVLALVLWYVVISLLGWVVYPFLRIAMYGLKDHGYVFSKLAGMLLLALFAWLAGSAGIPVTRLTLTIILLVMLIASLVMYTLQRARILGEWHENRKYYLAVEIATLAFFLFFILIRLGNPDLWHPAKGGEKPMDFSYFNAVIKSTTFPPFDPWYAGGYINYYYYGFVVVGMLVKWLGIVPSIAYNLIVPTLYSFTAMGAFGVVWSLVNKVTPDQADGLDDDVDHVKRKGGWEAWYKSPWLASLGGAVLISTVGNLGTVRMIWQGWQKIALPETFASIEDGSAFQKLWWGLSGLWKYMQGASLPYGWGEWYWNPSRMYTGSPITEFPFFTFLYADLHAHMISLPITILAAAWAVSVLRGRWMWEKATGNRVVGALFSLVMGGIVIGALKPTNTWDLPAYLAIAGITWIYTALRYSHWKITEPNWPAWVSRAAAAVGGVFVLVVLTIIIYQPFSEWYAQGYSSLALWKEAEQAAVNSYLLHWGLFLFVIVSWLWYETIDWMANTPVSALRKLQPYRAALYLGGIVVLLGIAILMLVEDVHIAWIAVPIALWAGVNILRPNQSEEKRFVLFLVGTAMVITLFVEVFVLVGDIGRMNTVFKFYMQAWSMLAISSGAGLYWLLPAVFEKWSAGWRRGWQSALCILVGMALLFPLLAGADKIRDRMSSSAPHTLDGMAYMATSRYNENGVDMDLSYDYRAIIWMQENVQGSPVIVEGKTGEYHWGTRFTIYTGLPGVVGWNWHQIQQRSTAPGELVTNRINDINQFYNTVELEAAKKFLSRYDVDYIIVGQLEQAIYTAEGLAKFEANDGYAWDEVYRDGSTAIYEVKR